MATELAIHDCLEREYESRKSDFHVLLSIFFSGNGQPFMPVHLLYMVLEILE